MVRTLAMALEETNHFLDFCCDIDYVKKNLNCCLTKGCNEYAHLLLTVSVNIYLITTYIYFFLTSVDIFIS